jgi:uncharacterized protein HemX
MRVDKKTQNGFLLVALLIGVVIILIIVGIYYGGTKEERQSRARTNQQAIDQAKDINQNQLQQQIEIQNQLNSIE